MAKGRACIINRAAQMPRHSILSTATLAWLLNLGNLLHDGLNH